MLRFGLIAIELAIFDLCFLLTMKRKEFAFLKIGFTVLITLGITSAISVPILELYKSCSFDDNIVALIGAAMQLLILFLLGGGFYFAFDISFYKLCSALSLGYASRFIVFSLYSLVFNFINPDLILIRVNQQTPLNIFIYIAFYLILIFTAYFFTLKKNKNINFVLEFPIMIVLMVVIVANTIVLSFAETISEEHLLPYSFVLISNIITLGLTIVLNFYTQITIKVRLENQLSYNLLKKQEEQYKFSKANAEQMNVKAHDLKHQVNILRKGGEDAEKILSELDSVVSNYESVIITDNNVMNIIISEKWQYCIKHNIKLSCEVDPKAFVKMDNIHLYTLLANVLDNSIEAVMRTKDKEKRVISLTITHDHGVSILQNYNYFQEEIILEDGLPVTNKEDKAIHGYGVKSIKNIAEQYGGNINIKLDKDIFTLQVIIPD